MAAAERLIVAHGGALGLAVELGAILAIVLLGLVVWISNRRGDAEEDEEEPGL